MKHQFILQRLLKRMAKTAATRKAKGRKFQQWVRDALLNAFKTLSEDDVRSTSMGAGGEDILLSPAARKLFPYSVECKHHKSFAIYKVYEQAADNAKKSQPVFGYQPVAFIKADHKKPLVVLDADVFIQLVNKGLEK